MRRPRPQPEPVHVAEVVLDAAQGVGAHEHDCGALGGDGRPPTADTAGLHLLATASTLLAVGSLPHDLGAYLREQRQHAKLTLRQLAELAEVSNPYLSQIERGLKKPSAEILQSLAKGLRVSAESLYVRAGILEERDEQQVSIEAAILADPVLSEQQKRVLLDIYESFRAESARADAPTAAPRSPKASDPTARASKRGTPKGTATPRPRSTP